MPTIEEIRQSYPQYNDMSDADLGSALHTKFYSDMPREDFNQKIGLTSDVTASGMAKQYGVGVGKTIVSNSGLGGDIRELAGGAADWVASKLKTPSLSDLIAPGSGPSSFDERFTGQPQQTAGDVVKAGLRHMPGMAGTFFSMPTSSTVQKGVEGITGEFRKPQNFPEQVADTAGQFTPAMIGGPLNAGRNVATRVAKTFATNVVAPALTSEAAGEIPGVKGSAAEPFVKAGAALATPAALSATRAAFTPVVAPSNRQAAADYLKSEGVKDLMAGQITGSEKQQYREATAGWKYDASRRKQLEQLTEAANKRFGETGSDAIVAVQRAKPRIGADIENAAKDLYVRMDPEFMGHLQNVEREAARIGLTQEQTKRLAAVRDSVLQAFDIKKPPKRNVNQDGYLEMSGEAFHNAIRNKSDLDLAIKEKGIVGHYATELKTALLDVAARTGEDRRRTGVVDALNRLQEARRQWANMLAVEKAINKPGAIASGGILSPAGVFTAAANRDKKALTGKNDFAQLAQASNLLMTSLPNSGTAGRLMAQLPSKVIGGGIGSGIGGLGMLASGASVANPLVALAALPAWAGAYLGPKAQNAFVMSKRGQYLAGNRPAANQPNPALTREQQIRRLMLLTRPAIATSQSEYGR